MSFPFGAPADEVLFRRYRERHDCQALGQLFRRRAEELLRIAVFLAPQPSDAEDLVQATFLAAISHADQFRDDGRVMSWLCGILTNQARMLRRAGRRRGAPLPTTATPPAAATTEAGPVGHALHAELRAALTQAIANLPEPYRGVLHLHLHEGLDSVEISRQLARPPATVRKQLERGFDRLREALPLGLATGLVLQMAPDALAQHAADAARYADPPLPPSPVDAAASTARRGFPTGARWLAAVTAATALVAVLRSVVWPLAIDPSPAATPASTSPIAATHESQPESPTAPTLASIPASGDRATVATATSLRITARTADGELRSGVPLVVLPYAERSLAERLLGGEGQQLVTDAGGEALANGLLPGWHMVLSPGGAAAITVFANQGENRADWTTAAPQQLRGRVIDANGQPVANATLLASASAGRTDAGIALGTTAADGSFTVSTFLAGGQLFASHPEYAPSPGIRMAGDRDLELRLAAPARRVTVVVTDPEGHPLADSFVALVPQNRSTELLLSPQRCTDHTGRCTFLLATRGPTAVVASRADRAAAVVDLGSTTDHCTVELVSGGPLHGRALDADGRPVAQREIQAAPPALRGNEPVAGFAARRAITDADGRFTFSHLPPGPIHVRMRAAPTAPGTTFGPHLVAATEVTVTEGIAQTTVLQERAAHRTRGRLCDADGAPLAGWLLVATPDSGADLHRLMRTRSVLSGPDGTFTLTGLRADEAYQLGAFPPRAIGTRAFPQALAACPAGSADLGDLSLEALASPQGRVRCRIVDPTGRPIAGAALELRALDFQLPHTATSGPDGRAEFAGLVPGRYRLARAMPQAGTQSVAATVGTGDAATIDLGDLPIGPPALLTVTLQGAGRAGARVLVRHGDGEKYVAAITDEHGTARLTAVPPGRLRLSVHGPGLAPLRRELNVAAGPQQLELVAAPAHAVQLEFTYPPAENPFAASGPLLLEVFTAAGALVFDDYLVETGPAGRFTCHTGLPPGSYRLRARTIWNASAEAELQVDGAGVQRAVALTLP